jgi:hypothetical protein
MMEQKELARGAASIEWCCADERVLSRCKQMNLPTGERIPVSGTAGGVLGVGKVMYT